MKKLILLSIIFIMLSAFSCNMVTNPVLEPEPTATPTSSPTPSPTPTQVPPVLYLKSEGNTNYLYAINEDGTDNVKIQVDPSYHLNPSWSPDGKEVVLEYSGKLYIYSFQTLKLRLLFNENVSQFPCWTTNNVIAFVNNNFIYVINPDGSNMSKLFTPPNYYDINSRPSFSPDGKYIACSLRYLGDYYLFIIDLANGSYADISKTGIDYMFPEFSPDSSQIAYQSLLSQYGGELCITNIDNSVSATLSAIGGFESRPKWSPDGSELIYSSNHEGGDYDIYKINVSTRNITKLTDSIANEIRADWRK